MSLELGLWIDLPKSWRLASCPCNWARYTVSLCGVPGPALTRAFSWRGRGAPPFSFFGQDSVCPDEHNEPLIDVFVFDHVGLGDFYIVDYFGFHGPPD